MRETRKRSMSAGEEEENLDGRLFHFQDEATQADPIHDYPDSFRQSKVPIIIDNGSFQCRVGWASDTKPRMIFKNVIAKQRGRKDCEVQIGNDISNIEVVRWQLKTQFERNVVTHFDSQELVYDYIFSHLGINSQGAVEHPIVLTEPLCNPNYFRNQMSELLFEAYHVPSVTYGVDSLFSLYNDSPHPESTDALLVSCGYHTLSVMPVLNGRLDAQYCRRINMGGVHLDSFMQRLLQLKYPGHLASLTLSRAEELNRDHCHLAVDYQRELGLWSEEDYYMSNVHIMELPHAATAKVPVNVPTAEQQKEKRENQIKRLKEVNQRRREEKLAADQERLQLLFSILQLQEEDEAAFERGLKMHDFESPLELQMAINNLNNNVNKLFNKMLMEKEADQSGEAPKAKKAKDDKKHQSLIQQIENMRNERDMDTFLEEVRQQKQKIVDTRQRRKQRRSDMAKRRTLAAQQRMKIITELAQGSRRKKEDTFGQNDDDWNVYKQINKDAGDSDSEAEQERLEELDTILKLYDPNFKDPNEEPPPTPVDPKEYYRLYVGVERIRIPELMFQPSMMGVEQAGLGETIDFVLKKYSPEDQTRLVENLFLTGSCSAYPHLKTRLEHELLAMRPFQSKFKVTMSSDPVLGAWHGARKWALSPAHQTFCVTRKEYEEMGGEYIKEYVASNRYFTSPLGALRRNDSSTQLLQENTGQADSADNKDIKS